MLFKKKTHEKLISAMNTSSDNSFWNLLLVNKEEILKKHFEYRKFCDVLLGGIKKRTLNLNLISLLKYTHTTKLIRTNIK